jgi:DNA polymerase III subunit chi
VTLVHFYEFDGGPDAGLALSCRLAAKALAQGLDVLIHCPQADTRERLDLLLWACPPAGFLPHGREPDPRTPITLNAGDPGHHHGLLINLAPVAPGWFSRFERLVEFVHAGDPGHRQQMRERFRFYRDRGYDTRHTRLDPRALAA